MNMKRGCSLNKERFRIATASIFVSGIAAGKPYSGTIWYPFHL
jgi:hypothetical protein